MGKLPFMKFFPQDYLYDTRILTPEEKGVWMDLLCFLWNSKERGEISSTPQHLAQMVGMEWGRFEMILNSLKEKGICEMRRNGDATVTLLSRRMRRDGDALSKNAERQERYRQSHILRQKRYREKVSNALVTPKKSEVRSQKLDKDSIGVPPNQPPSSNPKELTPIQKVVTAFKIVSGYPKEDLGWDKINFARCSKSAKSLLDFLGTWDAAVDCVQDVYEKFSGKGLTVTLETVVKHASDWKKDRQERRPTNGVLHVPSYGSR